MPDMAPKIAHAPAVAMATPPVNVTHGCLCQGDEALADLPA
jgi:hypothetical protein